MIYRNDVTFFNFRFLTGGQDIDGVVTGPYSFTNPVNPGLPILDPNRAPVVYQAAPNDFVHPVNILREYLAVNTVNGTSIGGLGRVNAKHGKPVSECDPTLVQPIQGMGPDWMARDVEPPCRPQDN